MFRVICASTLAVIVLLVFLFFTPHEGLAAGATAHYWIEGTSGTWNDGANWSTAGSGGASCSCIPDALSSVFFDGNGVGTVTLNGNIDVASISIGSGFTGDFSNSGDYDVSVSGNFNMDGTGTLSMGDAVWRVGGNFEVDTITGTLLSNSSTLYLTTNASLAIGGTTHLNRLVIADADIVAHWPMEANEAAGSAYDFGVKDLEMVDAGTEPGDDTSDLPPVLFTNNAVRTFDGTGYFTLADTSDIPTSNFTISMWFKDTVSGDDDVLFSIGNNDGGTAGVDQIELSAQITTSNTLEIVYNGAVLSIPTTTFDISQWTHLAIVRSSDDLYVYVDGNHPGGNSGNNPVATSLPTINYSGCAMLLGAEDRSTNCSGSVEAGSMLNGKMDDVRIYNRALALSEVQDLANGYGFADTASPTRLTLQEDLHVSTDLDIRSGAINVSSVGDYDIYLANDWKGNGNGLLAQEASVIFDGSGQQDIFGTTTFYNLTRSVSSAATFGFQKNMAQVIGGAFAVNGVSGQLLSLRSVDPAGITSSTQATIDVRGSTSLQYLDVKDHIATSTNSAVTIPMNPASSTNSGNNSGWFGGPAVTTGNITATISLDMGLADIAAVNDVIRVVWDNSASGDDNAGITDVDADLSAFGGDSAQELYDNGTNGDTTSGDEIYTYELTLTSGSIDTTTAQVVVSATTVYGTTNTTDETQFTVDTEVPALMVDDISATISKDLGTSDIANIGDHVLVTWDASASGGDVDDVLYALADMSGFGGTLTEDLYDNGANGDVTASDDIYSYALTISSGTIDATNIEPSITVVDDAGNVSSLTDSDSDVSVDNEPPIVTDANITATISEDNGVSGIAGIGDTIRVTWDNRVAGDNNSDTIQLVVMDLRNYGGLVGTSLYDDGTNGDAASGDGVYTYDLLLTEQDLEETGVNFSGIVMDDAGNTATVIDTDSDITIDLQKPEVAEEVAVTSVTNDATPSVSFSSTESGTLVVGGACRSATSAIGAGTTTVALRSISNGDLANATYSNCTMVVQDSAGNESDAITLTAFTVDTLLPTITVTAPDTSSLVGTDITTTTIRVTDGYSIKKSRVGIDVSSTAKYSSVSCTQTSTTQVDCTMRIKSSGQIVFVASDDASNTATKTASGYVFSAIGSRTVGVMKNEGGDQNFYIFNIPHRGPATLKGVDRWNIPSGNNVIAVAYVNVDLDPEEEIAVIRRSNGDNNLFVYDPVVGIYGARLVTRDDWTIPDMGHIAAMAGMDLNGDGIDEIGVVKENNGDQNLYVYSVPSSYIAARHGATLRAADLWCIPSGNAIVAMSGADYNGDGKDEIVVVKDEKGDQNVHVYSLPYGSTRCANQVTGDYWNMPAGNNVVDIAAIDYDGDGQDELGIVKDDGGDYNYYIYNIPSMLRGATLASYDLWTIPSGNNVIRLGLGS